MADTADSILLIRLQETGANLNIWGGYLNTALQTMTRADKGYQEYTVNGDATISWSNFSASNDLSVANVKLVAGTASASFTLTAPSYQQDVTIWNATSYAATIKVSGGTGVTIPAGRIADVFCDGTDFRTAGITYLPTFATPLVNAGDIVTKSTLETAIANATLAATAGTVLISAADTTAKYLNQTITVTVTGSTTLQVSTLNPGANEQLQFALSSDDGQAAFYASVFGI